MLLIFALLFSCVFAFDINTIEGASVLLKRSNSQFAFTFVALDRSKFTSLYCTGNDDLCSDFNQFVLYIPDISLYGSNDSSLRNGIAVHSDKTKIVEFSFFFSKNSNQINFSTTCNFDSGSLKCADGTSEYVDFTKKSMDKFKIGDCTIFANNREYEFDPCPAPALVAESDTNYFYNGNDKTIIEDKKSQFACYSFNNNDIYLIKNNGKVYYGYEKDNSNVIEELTEVYYDGDLLYNIMNSGGVKFEVSAAFSAKLAIFCLFTLSFIVLFL